MNSQATFVSLTYFNSTNYGHINKKMSTRQFWISQLWIFVAFVRFFLIADLSWKNLSLLLIVKLSWHSCSMWDDPGWLNWFWQFLCEVLSSFDPKGFYYSYVWFCNSCHGRTSFCTGLIFKKLCRFLLMFSTGFTFYFLAGLTSFSSIDHLFRLYARFLILFHLI